MRALFLISAALLAAACRKDAIETRRVPKEESAPMGAAGAMGPMSGAEVPAPPAAHDVTWKTPAGWTEAAGSAMRVATLTPPPSGGKAEVTVIALPGDVGGELANVNRWRGQLSLPAVTEDAVGEGRTTLRSGVGPVNVYDFTGSGTKKTRLVAGMVSVRGTMWFFKLMGDEPAVAKAKPAFLELLEGLSNDAP